jgi:hypothetical protein
VNIGTFISTSWNKIDIVPLESHLITAKKTEIYTNFTHMHIWVTKRVIVALLITVKSLKQSVFHHWVKC